MQRAFHPERIFLGTARAPHAGGFSRVFAEKAEFYDADLRTPEVHRKGHEL